MYIFWGIIAKNSPKVRSRHRIPLAPLRTPTPTDRIHLERVVRIQIRDKSHAVQLRDLREIRVLGEGQYGLVTEMFHEASGHSFAVKVILKHINHLT